MTAIREAVILMAGSGSRLRNAQGDLPKPLTPVLGRPLICYTLEMLASAGITKINIVVGYESDRLTAAVAELAPSNVTLSFVLNPEWQKQNGISLLAAAKNITSNFLLTMSDHLFDNVIVDLLMESAVPSVLNLTVDRKINSIFDLDDAMKVQTQGGRVVAIGKELPNYDAIDTGLFVCPIEIFTYLERAKENEDCSLADSVRLMARDGKVRAIDIGDAWWQDIDTVEMLQHAEKHMTEESKMQRLAK
jgi:1L-myo-inositol 1-phosphate cytidylyltransferase